jgi:hypothetical protein
MSLSRAFALTLASFLGFAQAAAPAAANPLDAIDEDDREALEALAVYPEDVREQALRVATEPATLIELQKLQDRSQETFRDLLGPYSQDDQEQLFELARYPDLVETIATGGAKSRGELERIASGYPDDARAAALRQGSERPNVVARMHALLADFDGRFARLVEDLPAEKQDAFRGMLRTPELLSLLNEHTSMTVLLGDAYERDPGEVRGALEDMNLEVAKRNAEEADDWKKTVDADPDLKRDYDAAAADYQRDTGYSAYQQPSRTVVNVSINPYPYWFGYPWWYPVSYTYYDPWYWWYPRHYWGHCGYSYGPRVVLYGGPVWRPWYPTFGFTSWYFSHGHHHARYPYLSDRFVSHYERPIVNHVHYDVHKRVVKKFIYDTDGVMPAAYFKGKNRRDRVERFREFGKLAPQIEKAQKERRGKSFAREGGKRPGRDFDIRERKVENDVARSEVQKIVAKDPKQFPELSKVKKEDWDRGDGRRGKNAGGGLEREREGDKADRGKTGRGERGTAAGAPGLQVEPGGGDKGKGDKSDRARVNRPSGEPDGGKRGQGADRGRDDGPAKARPSFDRPGEKPKSGTSSDAPDAAKRRSGDRPSGGDGGGGAKRGNGGDGGKRGKGGDADRGSKGGDDSARARPTFDAPDRGSDRPRAKQERVREPEPRREPQQVPSYDPQPDRSGGGRNRGGFQQDDSPRVQRAEPPRVERSDGGGGGGGGRKSGGGGDGGGGRGKKNRGDQAEEEAGGGGGGGGGGRGGKR